MRVYRVSRVASVRAARGALRAAVRRSSCAASGSSGRAPSSETLPRVEVTVRVDEDVRRWLPGEPRVDDGRARRRRLRASRRRVPRAAALRLAGRGARAGGAARADRRDGPRGRRDVRSLRCRRSSTYALFIADGARAARDPRPGGAVRRQPQHRPGAARGARVGARDHDGHRRARHARDRRALVARARVAGRLRRRALRRRRVSHLPRRPPAADAPGRGRRREAARRGRGATSTRRG